MTARVRQAFIGAGANLRDRRATLCAAVDRLQSNPAITAAECSPLYETDPVGVTDQPAFLNLVLGIETTLEPEALLAALQAIEHEFGRIRTLRWGPRTLDLDLLAFEGETRATAALQLPHPRMLEREFVTAPLRDVIARSRFQRTCWEALRGRLLALPPPSTAVRRVGQVFDLPEGGSQTRPTEYAKAREYLLGLKARGVRPGLDRMKRFVAALGYPERSVPCIHISGTNGKGSVAAMLEAMLRTAGWRTGLYTSPHLVRLGERVQVDRTPATPGQLARLVHALRPIAEELGDEGPSYFEFMTAVAFTHFARERCDIAIIETGLGGRLDATNVVMPELSVITSIGFDHMEFLGATLEEIAREKAGIIKPGRPVVIGVLPPPAEHVVRAIAAERGAPMKTVAEAFGTDSARYPSTNLGGEHQRINAAVATLAARTLPSRWRLDDDAIARGLARVDWPGRWQRVPAGSRTIILDAAHNADGARSLERSLAQVAAESGRAPVVVIGVLGASRATPLLEVVCRHAREIHLVVPRQSRACGHAELEALAPVACRERLQRSTVQALFPAAGTCTAGDERDTIVVTGSIYLVGEVLARLEPTRGPLEDELQDF